MPSYVYKAVSPEGKATKGFQEAPDKTAVLYLIKEKGLLPLEVNEDRSIKHILNKINLSYVPVKELAIFCRQFSTILTSGVTVLTAMDILRKQTSNKKLQKGVESVFESLQKGNTLSQSMKAQTGVFPELLINMIDSGEVSGTLDSTMYRMAAHYEKESKTNQKIRSAMSYPMILLGVSCLMIVFMVYFVLPNFMTLIDSSGGKVPELTKFIINATNYVRNKWYVVLAVPISAILIFRWLVSKGKGRLIFHKALLKLPVLGRTLKKIIATRFARTLGIMLASGIPLLVSLEATCKVVANAVAEENIQKSIAAVKNGQSIADTLDKSGIFEPLVIQMIRIGEDTGSLDSMLSKAADFFDEEVETSLTQLMNILTPAMLLIMGVIVGTVVISMLLPMYSMLDGLGG